MADVKLGPAGGDCQHIQIESGKGSDKPMRKVSTTKDGGYSVTSAAPTPSSTMDLAKRP
jgi:hypothetical protein